jgi:PKD repeat protein
VSLTVTNGGCSNTYTKVIHVLAEAADFNASKTAACKNEIITLSAINSNPDNISSYDWSINGGPILTGRSIQTAFGNSGTYTVQLTITDSNGCKDTKSVANYISITGPTADFTVVDTGGCRGTSIQFNDLSSPTSGITKWKWNFGDGQTQTFTSGPFTHQFKDSGDFKIELTITDKQGCEDVMKKDSLIRITAPKADFYAVNTLFCAGGTLQFKDSSANFITNTRS